MKIECNTCGSKIKLALDCEMCGEQNCSDCVEWVDGYLRCMGCIEEAFVEEEEDEKAS